MSKNALQTCLRKISLRNKKIFKNVLLGLVWWEDSVLLMQRVQVRSLVGEPKIPHTRQWSQKKKKKEKLCCYKYNTKNDQSLPKNNYLHFKCKHSKMEKHSVSCKLAPYREGKEKLRQEADHFRSVDGSFQKQDNLWMRLVLVGRKMNRYPQPVARILKVSTELLVKSSHISSPYGSTLLSQD